VKISTRDPGRDRKALIGLVLAVVLFFVVRALLSGDAAGPKVVGQEKTTEMLELRLRSLRTSMSRVPGKEAVLKQVAAELATREKRLIVADTVNQAQAQVLDVVKRLARKEGFDIRGSDFSVPRTFGDAYGEVTVAINAECTAEQLVNLMADLGNEPQLLATNELRISTGNPKLKTINLRLTVTGLVPRKLVPEKKA
jgi:Type II secretion system (T2SS), protein M subtype b